MNKETKSKIISIFSVAILSGFATTSLVANETYKRKSSSTHSILIKSNASNAVIMKDGLLVGKTGDVFDATLGTSNLVISASGYFPRAVEITVSDKELNIIEEVNLVPAPKNVETDPSTLQFETFRKAISLEHVPSICRQQISNARNPVCFRNNLRDDISFARLSWQLNALISPSQNLSVKGELDLVRNLDNASSDEFFKMAEKLFLRLPSAKTAAALLAYSALTRENCQKVYQVHFETSRYKDPNPHVALLYGICKELENNSVDALKTYSMPISHLTPELHFHTLRLQTLNGYSKTSQSVLDNCLSKFPDYYPCHEAGIFFHQFRNDKKSVSLLKKKHTENTKKLVSRVFQKLLPTHDGNPKKQLAILKQAFLKSPYSYEIGWKFLLAKGITKDTALSEVQTYTTGSMISSATVAKAVLSEIENTGNTQILEHALSPFLLKYPHSTYFWERLAAAKKKRGQCEALEQLVKDVIQQKDGKLSKRSYLTLNSHHAECLLQQEKFLPAAKVFMQLVSKYPSSWRAHYNLGATQERMGQAKEALTSFKTALSLNPPTRNKLLLEEKIKFYTKRLKRKGNN
jgi:tetratricopeptide (TPR) repeat protein